MHSLYRWDYLSNAIETSLSDKIALSSEDQRRKRMFNVCDIKSKKFIRIISKIARTREHLENIESTKATIPECVFTRRVHVRQPQIQGGVSLLLRIGNPAKRERALTSAYKLLVDISSMTSLPAMCRLVSAVWWMVHPSMPLARVSPSPSSCSSSNRCAYTDLLADTRQRSFA